MCVEAGVRRPKEAELFAQKIVMSKLESLSLTDTQINGQVSIMQVFDTRYS
jgi:hypothetical protein